MFRKVAQGWRRASEGKAGITPAGFVTWVGLVSIDGAVKVAGISVHFIAKAWFDPPEPDAAWRQEQWTAYLGVLLDVVAELEADGFAVVVAGDVNRSIRDVIPGMVERPTTGVDRVAVGHRCEIISARKLDREGSDHLQLVADIRVTPPKE